MFAGNAIQILEISFYSTGKKYGCKVNKYFLINRCGPTIYSIDLLVSFKTFNFEIITIEKKYLMFKNISIF